MSSKNGVKLTNYYEVLPKKYRDKYGAKYPNYDKIRVEIPSNILICGRTGSGKTNLLINLIALISVFDRIYLFSKALDEPLYRMLIGEMTKFSEKTGEQCIFYSNSFDEVPAIEEFDKTKNNLCVFDDFISSKHDQERLVDILIRGRKSNITTCILTQSYHLTLKPIRDQCSYILLKTISSKKDLGLVLKNYNFDKDEKELMKMYKIATSSNGGLGGFLMIDTRANSPPEYQFRNGFVPFSQT